ncbi:hypothetical protein V5E97_39715 [Singulisphaera sp. Ch08]|uniref:Uncharacterized protein n=1 Tax=Singulisphaera sp. Ch08 TaxID=3120278 RepID=A0AAU7CH58_9BACT
MSSVSPLWSLEIHDFKRLRFTHALLRVDFVISMGCGKGYDTTGDVGIGAPWDVNPNFLEADAQRVRVKPEAEDF